MARVHATQDAARSGLVAEWNAVRQQSPRASQIMLATERGERAFAEGDRISFLKNERPLGVKNGTLGTIEQIQNEHLFLVLDDTNGAATGRTVSFDLKDYAEIDQGYAVTLHKSQGVTVYRAHVLATVGMDRHMPYVRLLRHRESATLHWSPEERAVARGSISGHRHSGPR